MNENTYINSIIAQVRAIRTNAEIVLSSDHHVVASLDLCLELLENRGVDINDLEDELFDGRPAARVIPAPFTEETYATFLEKNLDVDNGDINYDEEDELDELDAMIDRIDNVADVVGLIPNEDLGINDGGYTQVGDFDAAATAAADRVAAYEEANGEVIASNSMTVTYTRMNGQELTDTDVRTILEHPISKTLGSIGNVQFLTVADGDSNDVKNAIFIVLEDNKDMLKSMAMNAVAYRGVHVFPGLGSVRAVGRVDFA